MKQTFLLVLIAIVYTFPDADTVLAQMQVGEQMKDFATVFGVPPSQAPSSLTVTFLEDKTSASSVLAPGEQPALTFLLTNNTSQPIKTAGKVDVIHYGTRGTTGDVWRPEVFKFEDLPSLPIDVNIPANGSQVIDVTATLPETFGAYGFVFDFGSLGRQFGCSVVRTFAPTPKKLQFPKVSLDYTAGVPILKSLGIQAIRMEVAYVPTDDPNYGAKMAAFDAKMKLLSDNNITVLLVLYASAFNGDNAALGRYRPYLDANDTMLPGVGDIACLPKCDADFQKWVGEVSTKYGWPNGPVTAVELWNEPWEGSSISGWGADMPRFRELYTAMAQGVEEARATGAQVLITGCDSSTNAWDKLFSDAKDDYLKWFDAVTLHYQGLWSPSLYRVWRNRTGPYGRVKIWDTESWVANSEDRIAAVIAGDRAAGYDRTMGVFWGNVSKENPAIVKMPDGTQRQVDVYFPWPPAAALAATQHFLGQREFRELLFPNGLPWVMVFDGEDNNPDDGTVVVVGDLREAFNPKQLLFRNVEGLAQLKNEDQKEALRQQIAALPEGSQDRTVLEGKLQGLDVLSGGSLTFPNPAGEFVLYDFYGNPVPTKNGNMVVPLDSHGFFLRGNGTPGSFGRLLKAIHDARIEGYEPLNIAAHDFIAPIESKPSLRLTLTNILNRPVSGSLQVILGDLKLDVPAKVDIGPNETKDVLIPVIDGAPRPDNTYPLNFKFDAGADGFATLKEKLHVNLIAKRTITVDGNLDDWKGVLPQPVYASGGEGPSQAVEAWLPFEKFTTSQKPGIATGYLAYDDKNFYFAVKVADNTPSPGTIRFATRNDDDYFYPDVSYNIDDKTHVKTAYNWPAGVRHYSYRKDPIMPFGSFPNFDNVQIAFNVIPLDQKEDLLPSLPGVMPGFIPYRDTDYEYALNKVADANGGGTEIWRCRVPGMPAKNFYPRQPASPFDGAVANGQLVVKQDDTTRIVEAAIPWSEIPLVKKALDENKTIKFSFRVNDDKGPSMELAEGRSVSKQNTYAFHPDFVPHWANEIEFGFEK